MALKVTIQEITFSEAGNGPRKYKKADVVYTWQGNNRKQTVMSFSNPDVFKTLQGLKTPVDVDVELTKSDGKDGKEYTNWSKVTVGGSAPQAAGVVVNKVVGSNYETAAERAKRQLMIVRQSSIANALTYFSDVNNEEGPAAVSAVLEIAQQFVDFVYGTNEKLGSMDGIEQDIPE